jgi:tRNA (guanine26-N2/guanine27-N2)-dimethyltransferase
MKKQVVVEGKARVIEYTSPIVSKDLPVFYNPVMKLNRDLSILLLSSFDMKKIRVADIMAGSGIRSVRFALETKKGAIEEIHSNDGSLEAVASIKKNIALNKIKKGKIFVSKKDANLFLLESEGFEYIDIDPFGSPVPFLDPALRRLSRGGILAVTATDTAPLCGTYPKTCLRRYWSTPKKCGMMHELGLRILIKRVQLIGAQFDKALVPIFSMSTEHYFRIFFVNEKGKNAVDSILKQHGMLEGAGPLWLGQLWDEQLTRSMKKLAGKNKYNEAEKLLEIIEQESSVHAAGFYDIHELCGKNRLNIPKREVLIDAIVKKGYAASVTHFKGEGIRSTIPEKELILLIRKLGS